MSVLMLTVEKELGRVMVMTADGHLVPKTKPITLKMLLNHTGTSISSPALQ